MASKNTNSLLPPDPDRLAALLPEIPRALLIGPPGSGKSTLAAALARRLGGGAPCRCLSADPGSPAFGLPGTLGLATWKADHWEIFDREALCTLDAGRFRLPLLRAVAKLLARTPDGPLLIDAPGVMRGVAAAELLPALAEITQAATLLLLCPGGREPALPPELAALGLNTLKIRAADEARNLGRQARARRRTAPWDDYLADARELTLSMDRLSLTGTPPPADAPEAWHGRQVALYRGGGLLGMAEVEGLSKGALRLKARGSLDGADTLLLRDALRSPAGLLVSAAPWQADPLRFAPPPEVLASVEASRGPRLVGRAGPLDLALVNGVFGDPLLHARLRHQGRSLLFDLGESGRLSTRLAHQVSDVFITHAHLDHIGGFGWLLRSRIGNFPPCRLYGPPGLAGHVAGYLKGALWDRVEGHAPRFEVVEFDGALCRRFTLDALHPDPELRDERQAPDGVLLREADFLVRAALLDHEGTWVAAYAFEPVRQLNVRKDRLAARGLAPGPWLNQLKHLVREDAPRERVSLPDGAEEEAEELARELLIETPGKRLAYATDFADKPDNRRRLRALADGVHTFFCEASFLLKEADNARRTGHLTTRSCGEIAADLNVGRLAPFHFSRRYQDDPGQVYDEIEEAFGRVARPPEKMFEAEVVGIPDAPFDGR